MSTAKPAKQSAILQLSPDTAATLARLAYAVEAEVR